MNSIQDLEVLKSDGKSKSVLRSSIQEMKPNLNEIVNSILICLWSENVNVSFWDWKPMLSCYLKPTHSQYNSEE